VHLSQPNINNSSRNLINAVTKETEGRTSLSLSRSRCLILCIPSLISRRCFRLSAKKEQCGFLRPKLLAQLRRKTAAILNFKTRKRNRRLIEFITPRFHHDMGCRKKNTENHQRHHDLERLQCNLPARKLVANNRSSPFQIQGSERTWYRAATPGRTVVKANSLHVVIRHFECKQETLKPSRIIKIRGFK